MVRSNPPPRLLSPCVYQHLRNQDHIPMEPNMVSSFKIIAWNCSTVHVLIKSFLFTSAKLFTLQLYMTNNVCHSFLIRYFWLVRHSFPIDHKGGHVFHWIQNTVCLLRTTVHSVYMYLPENVFLYGEQEEGTDKSTFLEPALQIPVLSYDNNFVSTKGSYIFSSISPLYVLIRTNTMDTFLWPEWH